MSEFPLYTFRFNQIYDNILMVNDVQQLIIITSVTEFSQNLKFSLKYYIHSNILNKFQPFLCRKMHPYNVYEAYICV